MTSKAEVEQILFVPVVPGNSFPDFPGNSFPDVTGNSDSVPPLGKMITELGVVDDGVGLGLYTLVNLVPYSA